MKARRFDFYPDDWLAGTATLDAEEVGVYITAVAAIYSHGGPIPKTELRRLCRCHGNAYNRAVKRLLSLGKLIENGRDLSNKRCENELENARKRIEKAEQMAKKRWAETNKANGIDGDQAYADVPSPPSPSPSPSASKEDSEADASGAEAPDHDPVKELWDRGVKILGQSSRGLIGKARKQYGDIAVLQAIADCELEGPTEPAGFFVKCLQQGQRNERKQQSGYDTLARAAIEHDERQGNRGHPEAAYRPSRDAEELDDFGGIVH